MAARDTALTVFVACRQQGAWSNGVLKDYIARDRLDKREAALATRLCYGVVQNRMLLDFYLQQLVTGKLKRLQPIVLDVLRLGLYQLLFMDKIPASAAVNEAVKQAKRHGGQKAGGLVNAVLHNAIRQRQTLAQPKDLATKYSHPKPLVELLGQGRTQQELENMLRENNAAPETVVQVNTLGGTVQQVRESLVSEGAAVIDHPWMEGALVVSGMGSFERLEAYQKGLIYVQDAASRLAVQCAGPEKGMQILDCCAAPGGKSMTAAIAMENTGTVFSCDIHPHKAQLIGKNAQRLGLTAIVPQVQDATEQRDEWVGRMDVVLADVPCSGFGIIRKKPDIRYKDLTQTEGLPELQGRILENQAQYVKPGGVLLYSTCTVLSRENQGVVKDFLQRHPEFSPEPLQVPFAGAETGMLTLLPGQHDTDGFFICKLRRKP